jgi:hypothetical protein
MTQYGTWVSYGGAARIELAVVLLAAAAGLAYAGTRLRLPAQAARPGRAVSVFMLVTWVMAMAAFLVGLAVFVQQERHEYLAPRAAPVDHILPVTLSAAFVTFIIIFAASPHEFWTRLGSAAIGAMAAPMIFELPFDLIVMARTYPPIFPDPALYRALFFLPLLLIEITTLSLLTLSPMVKLSRGAFLSFAAMIAVFAAWSLAGFAYPSAPVPITLNVLSKLLAFGTVLSLFLPQRARRLGDTGTQDPRPAATDLLQPAAGPQAQ